MTNLRTEAKNNEETAAVFDQLVPLEPELADEHRDTAERYRGYAPNSRDFADTVARHLPQEG